MARKHVDIKTTGATGWLTYDNIIQLEEKYGCGVHEFITGNKLGIGVSITIFFLAMKNANPVLKPNDPKKAVQKYLDGGGKYTQLFEDCVALFKASGALGDLMEEEKEEKGPLEKKE